MTRVDRAASRSGRPPRIEPAGVALARVQQRPMIPLPRDDANGRISVKFLALSDQLRVRSRDLTRAGTWVTAWRRVPTVFSMVRCPRGHPNHVAGLQGRGSLGAVPSPQFGKAAAAAGAGAQDVTESHYGVLRWLF